MIVAAAHCPIEDCDGSVEVEVRVSTRGVGKGDTLLVDAAPERVRTIGDHTHEQFDEEIP